MKLRILNTARLSFPLAAAMAALLSASSASAATYTWDGGDTSNNSWGSSANWNATPTFNNQADIVFYASGAARLSTYLGGTGSARIIRSLTFNANADSDVTIRTTTTSTGNTAANLTFDTNTAGGDATITVNSGSAGDHTIGDGAGSIVLNDHLVISHSGSGTLTLGRPVTGAFNVTKDESGTLVMSGANTYSGTTTIQGGTLRLSNASALGGSSGITMNTASSTLSLGVDAAMSLPRLTGSSGSFTYTIISDRATTGAGLTHGFDGANFGNATFATNAGSNVTSGTAGISFSGTPQLVGGSSGTVTFAPGTANLTLPSLTATNAAKTLALAGTGSGFITGVISPGSVGITAVNKSSSSTWTLSGLNTFTGDVNISGGTLVAGSSGNGANSNLGLVSNTRTINVNTGGTLRFDAPNVLHPTFSTPAGSLPVLNIAGGTMTNGGTATNSALGDITLTGGTLSATTGSPIGTGQSGEGWGSWNLNGTVTSTGNSTISSTAPGGIPITLSATATNGYVTTFDVQSGTLTASAVFGDVTRVGNETVSGLAKTGAGTMVLSGINTYTGNTAINAGVLNIATKDALPGYNTSGRFSVAGGATLAVQNGVSDSELAAMLATTNFGSGAILGFDTAAGSRAVPLNLADSPSGPLGIVKLGANTLTLSGTNTYTGGTNVLAGTLNISSTSALPGWNVNGGFALASGTSLVIPNSVSEAEVTTMLGTTNIAAGASLLFDTSAGDRTYVSALTDSASGLLNIGKIGGNALTLAGASTFTGSTNITSGTLSVTGSIAGLPGSSKININPASGSAIFNYNGGSSTLFALTGSTVAGTASVFNMSGGTLTISPGTTTGTQNVTGAGNGAGNGAYGYYNITGGTFKNTNRFTVTAQAAASATNGTGAGVQTGVVYVGGNGFIDQTNGEWWLNYSLGQVTVAESGKIDRTGSTSPFGIFMNHAANVTGGGYGVLNLAGTNAQVILGSGQIRFGNSTTSTQGSGQSGFVNVAAGTLSVGANANDSLPAAPVSINNAYFNFAGGTVQASANLSGWIPLSKASINYNSNVFGPIDNPGTSQDFTGGLTLDSGAFNVAIANPLQAPGGFGVTQADLSVSGGSGYVGAPAVIFSSANVVAGGTPAAGYATISGGAVTGIVITSPGTYLAGTTPTVTLIGGGGTGASVTSGVLATANVSGGLTKTGSGILTLSGANTYTGATAVNAGTLNLTGSLASNVTVASNANLAGEGSTTGSLVFSGTSDLGFDPASPTSLTAASVNATGATVSILPTTVPTAATGIVVLEAAGGITGTAGGPGNNFIYTGRGTLSYNVGNTQLLLDAAPVSLAWRGNDGTNPTLWDLNTTTNWDSTGPQKFFTGDGVTFDDTATSFVVDINAVNVFPGNIVFNNTANTYTIQGAFGIYGSGTLTKTGTGTAVINTANGYTGTTAVNAGVLNIRNAMALGDVIAGTSVASGAALEIQGGITTVAEALTLNGSGILNNGALRNISGDNSWGAAVALGSDSTIGVDAGTLILPSLTGAFGLTKVGAGTLNITGATAVTSTTVEAGTLYMGAQTGSSTTTTLGAANPVTLNGSSNLTIRRTNTGGSDVVGAISGTGSLTLLGDNVNTLISGDFTMNNASTYAGGTTIIGARANVSTATSLGSGLVTTGTNGQVWVSAASLTLANDFAIGGLGWNGSSGVLGVLRLNSTNLTGDITLTSNARITGEGSSALSGKISGGFGIEFFEDTVIGTITLSGDNNYTGETIINSMGEAPATLPNLVVAHNNALGTSAGGTTVIGTGSTSFGSQLTLADGITVTSETLTLDTTAATGYRASLVTAGTATWDGNVITAGSGGGVQFYANGAGLTIGSSDTDTITGTNSLLLRGTGSGTVNSTLNMGTLGLFKTDAGTWTITSNNNDFTGTPAIANGILSVGSIADAGVNSALGAGTGISLGQDSAANGTGTLQFTGAAGGSSNRALLVNNGASGGRAVIENTVAGQTLALSGALTTNTPASASSLTLAGAGNGLLSGGIAGSPLMALNKTGAGTWTLTVANTYTSNTTIDEGTLVFATTNQSLTGGLTFGASAGSTNTGNLDLSAASASFSGAFVARTENSTAPASTITIGSGQSLNLGAGMTVGFNSANNTVTKLNVSGAGALNITAGNFQLGGNTTTNRANAATLDMSGLATFNYNVSGGTFRVGDATNSDGQGAAGSTLILADTSTITAAFFTTNNPGSQTQTIKLGSVANTINANSISIGAVTNRASAVMDFNESTGNLTIRDTAGTGRANLAVVYGSSTTGVNPTGIVDLTGAGHSADLLLDNLQIAGRTATSGGGATGTFSFGNGTLDATGITMAVRGARTTAGAATTGTLNLSGGNVIIGTGGINVANNSSAAAGDALVTGTVNISGGTVTVDATGGTSITLGSNTNAANGGTTAVLNLTGGTTTLTGDIVKGSTTGTVNSTVLLSGGSLDLGGNDIGAVGPGAITLTAEAGTLANVASINGTGGITKTTSGTLVLSGAITYAGDTTVNEGTLTLSSAASPANANTGNDASLVSIAATGATLNLTYTGTDVVNELYIGGVQKSPGVWGAVGSGAPNTDSRITGTGTLTVTTGPGGFASWITGAFNNGSVPGDKQGPNDDPDNDGIPNLVEYAIAGQDPTVSNSTIGTFAANTLSFAKRQPLAGDIDYVIQESTDLGNLDAWTPVTGSPPDYVNDGTTVSYTLSPPTPGQNFIRLQVTQTSP